MNLEHSEKIRRSPRLLNEIHGVVEIKSMPTGHANSLDEVELKKRFPKMWARAKLESR